MAIAESGTRSFYIDDYSDESVPCDCSLEGWAEWLSKPDECWEHDCASDGGSFAGSALLWLPDVLATFDGEAWSLSREPDGDFLALRFAPGSGWDGDSICNGRDNLIEVLGENAPDAVAGQVENVACGIHENGWRFTFRAGPPPSLEAERVQ